MVSSSPGSCLLPWTQELLYKYTWNKGILSVNSYPNFCHLNQLGGISDDNEFRFSEILFADISNYLTLLDNFQMHLVLENLIFKNLVL